MMIAGVRVEERRDLAVEVRGQPVPDVRLDQALEPVGGRRARVERVERRRRTAPSRRTGRRRARRAGASSRSKWANSVVAIRASSALSASAGAILASSLSRSKAEISPYAMAPSRSMTAAR